jgi:hypothetical protein
MHRSENIPIASLFSTIDIILLKDGNTRTREHDGNRNILYPSSL